MIPALSCKGEKVALFGLGGSGLATARALIAGGAMIAAWDDGEAARAKAQAQGVTLVNLAQADWSQFASFVLSPGVPLTHPKPHWTVDNARAAGVEIIGDIELFCRERARLAPHAPFVAITGTNGKSTTTALIAHILRTCGRDVQMGGNIGVPILELTPPDERRVHVVECSTFQIDLTPSLKSSVGVLLNLAPDHIDRHGSMDNYAAIKERLVDAADLAVVGVDDEFSRAIARRLVDRHHAVVAISSRRQDAAGAIFYENGALKRVGAEARVETLVDLAGVASLRGAHNGQNAAATFAACAALGLAPAEIGAAMRSFPGLAHRMEQVGALGKVLFVNDSKATNADAAEKALLSFSDIFWIAGGKAKEGGIEPLRPLFSRISKAYLIGAAADDFARTLTGSVPYEFCGTLDKAVAAAARDALASTAREPAVLLAPACASYDQFPNFEVRGAAFRDFVRSVIDAHGA